MPVFNARGTSGFAGTTPEATVDMSFKSHRINRKALFLHGTHQVNATARTIVLIARDDVGGTGLEAKPTMNAGEDFFFFAGENVIE